MKVPAALLTLALAGAAVAQNNLPPCAENCANGFLTNGIGNCSNGDVACICKNKEFLGSIACCLAGVCSQADQNQAVGFASRLCVGVGVTDLPTAVSCTKSATSTHAATSSAAETPNTAATSAAATTRAQTTSNAAANTATATTTSTNFGPRPTAAAGLGAIGGIMAAVALL
ncbi:hypothetical protein VTI74DRAFT_6109 [Chaetomium olivicolor]